MISAELQGLADIHYVLGEVYPSGDEYGLLENAIKRMAEDVHDVAKRPQDLPHQV